MHCNCNAYHENISLLLTILPSTCYNIILSKYLHSFLSVTCKRNMKELFRKKRKKFLLEWHAVNGMLPFVLNIESLMKYYNSRNLPL